MLDLSSKILRYKYLHLHSIHTREHNGQTFVISVLDKKYEEWKGIDYKVWKKGKELRGSHN